MSEYLLEACKHCTAQSLKIRSLIVCNIFSYLWKFSKMCLLVSGLSVDKSAFVQIMACQFGKLLLGPVMTKYSQVPL